MLCVSVKSGVVTGFTLGVKPRGTRPAQPVEIIQELHETHDYSLTDVKERLILVAQQRDDLPSKD